MKLASILFAALFSSFILHPSSFAQVDHSLFDAILKSTVRDERIDYKTVRARHAAELKAYLDQMAQVDVATLTRDHQLAYYINLYNATMIQAVLDRYRPGYSPSEKDFSVFKEPLVRLKGKMVSLNDLENNIIRPTFKEPRIHVALVCGARSCPPILNRAYAAENLTATLEENMKHFVADPMRNPIDLRRRELKLSKIFEWYADDFGGKGGVAAYVDKYHPADVGKFKVSFVEYSWELNDAK